MSVKTIVYGTHLYNSTTQSQSTLTLRGEFAWETRSVVKWKLVYMVICLNLFIFTHLFHQLDVGEIWFITFT